MPHPIRIEVAVLGTLAMLLSAAPASAQSIRGSMGPKSQAEVRISVRVLPRFTPQADPAAKADMPTVAHSSNAPSLRYTLVTQPGRPSGNGRQLILIVPD